MRYIFNKLNEGEVRDDSSNTTHYRNMERKENQRKELRRGAIKTMDPKRLERLRSRGGRVKVYKPVPRRQNPETSVLQGAGRTSWRNSLTKTAIGAGIGAGAGSLVGAPVLGAGAGAALATPKGRAALKIAGAGAAVVGGAAVGGAIGAGAAIARNFPTSAKSRTRHSRSPGETHRGWTTMEEDISRPEPNKGIVDKALSNRVVTPIIGAYLAAKAARAISPKDSTDSTDAGRVGKGIVRGAMTGLGLVAGAKIASKARKAALANKLPHAWGTDLNQAIKAPFATIKQKALGLGTRN